MTTFDERSHPRHAEGQFAAKRNSKPAGELAEPEKAEQQPTRPQTTTAQRPTEPGVVARATGRAVRDAQTIAGAATADLASGLTNVFD